MSAARVEALELVRRSVVLLSTGQSVAALAQWRRRAADMSLMRSVASRLLSMQVARALESWSSMAAARAEALEVVRRSVACAMSRELAAGLRCWRAATQADAQETAQKAALRRAVVRMLNQQLSAAWGSWASVAAARSEALQLMRHSLAFMVRREAACGFSSWRAATAASHERGEQARAAREAVGRTLHHHLAAAWSQWSSRASGAALLSEGVQQWATVELGRAWRSWSSLSAASTQMTRLLCIAFARMTDRGLAAAVAQWL